MEEEEGRRRRCAAKEARELSVCVSALEDCLKGALSQILEVEMKAAFEDLWTEVPSPEPSWTRMIAPSRTLEAKCVWCVVFSSTDSLHQTTLDSGRPPAVFQETLDRRLWKHCPPKFTPIGGKPL